MKRADTRLTTQMLQRQSRALKRHLPGAVKGDDRAVHQARVASRRLRESVPVLSAGLKGSKGKKARRKIRRLTGALGMVRELDVALKVVDELAQTDVSRAAIDELRAHVLAERQKRRDVMLERLDALDTDKLSRRLVSVAHAVTEAETEHWRDVLGRQSMLVWGITAWRGHHERVGGALREVRSDQRVIVLRSPSEVTALLEEAKRPRLD